MVLTWSGVDDGDTDEGHDEDGAKRLHVDDHGNLFLLSRSMHFVSSQLYGSPNGILLRKWQPAAPTLRIYTGSVPRW